MAHLWIVLPRVTWGHTLPHTLTLQVTTCTQAS